MVSSLLIILLAVLGFYFIAMSQTASQLLPSRQLWHLASFTLSLLVILIVFIPAPDLFGPDHRFTVSMGQMLFANDLGPLLLFFGIPAAMLQPLQRWKALMRSLAKPLLVGIVSTVILLGWFAPVFFEAASRNLAVWILKQVLFLISGLFFWWPVAAPLRMWKPAYPVQLVYLFVMRLPMTVLGILFTFADKLIYTSRSFSLEICAPSSISDQRTGGLVIWTIGGLIILAILSVVFFRWFNASEAAESQELSS
jgi:cytochrome c oxidase assembly factor CtaG